MGVLFNSTFSRKSAIPLKAFLLKTLRAFLIRSRCNAIVKFLFVCSIISLIK